MPSVRQCSVCIKGSIETSINSVTYYQHSANETTNNRHDHQTMYAVSNSLVTLWTHMISLLYE